MDLCGYIVAIDHSDLQATMCDGFYVNDITNNQGHESTSKCKSYRDKQYCQTSNMSHTKSQNLNVSCLVL